MRPLTPPEVHRREAKGLALVLALSVCVCVCVCVCLCVFAYVLVEGWSWFLKKCIENVLYLSLFLPCYDAMHPEHQKTLQFCLLLTSTAIVGCFFMF